MLKPIKVIVDLFLFVALVGALLGSLLFIIYIINEANARAVVSAPTLLTI